MKIVFFILVLSLQAYAAEKCAQYYLAIADLKKLELSTQNQKPFAKALVEEPSLEVLEKLSKEFGVSIDEIKKDIAAHEAAPKISTATDLSPTQMKKVGSVPRAPVEGSSIVKMQALPDNHLAILAKYADRAGEKFYLEMMNVKDFKKLVIQYHAIGFKNSFSEFTRFKYQKNYLSVYDGNNLEVVERNKNTPHLMHDIAFSSDHVISHAFSPDGKSLAYIQRYRFKDTLIIWDLVNKKEIVRKSSTLPLIQTYQEVIWGKDSKTVVLIDKKSYQNEFVLKELEIKACRSLFYPGSCQKLDETRQTSVGLINFDLLIKSAEGEKIVVTSRGHFYPLFNTLGYLVDLNTFEKKELAGNFERHAYIRAAFFNSKGNVVLVSNDDVIEYGENGKQIDSSKTTEYPNSFHQNFDSTFAMANNSKDKLFLYNLKTGLSTQLDSSLFSYQHQSFSPDKNQFFTQHPSSQAIHVYEVEKK